jgi:thiosulfate/3-mercaptopyruvate sulfurtransferase
MRIYAHPEVLVSTEWAAQHLTDPKVRFIEIDVDTAAYHKGHLLGAIGWNWQSDLNDKVRRNIIGPRAFAELNRRFGIRADHTLVFYGDNNNWFAAWALWQFKYYGHADVRLLDGGRKKWELEQRPLTLEPARISEPTNYPEPTIELSVRAFRRDIEKIVRAQSADLVDVRSPDEFTGKINSPSGLSEGAQRSGHIPGARNIPWSKTVNEDGSFKNVDELCKLYDDADIHFGRQIITYCRIGERSAHSWFVLKYLLGAHAVKNYDGSWTEWGNLVDAPIEVGETTRIAKSKARISS